MAHGPGGIERHCAGGFSTSSDSGSSLESSFAAADSRLRPNQHHYPTSSHRLSLPLYLTNLRICRQHRAAKLHATPPYASSFLAIPHFPPSDLLSRHLIATDQTTRPYRAHFLAWAMRSEVTSSQEVVRSGRHARLL